MFAKFKGDRSCFSASNSPRPHKIRLPQWLSQSSMKQLVASNSKPGAVLLASIEGKWGRNPDDVDDVNIFSKQTWDHFGHGPHAAENG